MEDRVLRVGEIRRGIWNWKTAELENSIDFRSAQDNLQTQWGCKFVLGKRCTEEVYAELENSIDFGSAQDNLQTQWGCKFVLGKRCTEEVYAELE